MPKPKYSEVASGLTERRGSAVSNISQCTDQTFLTSTSFGDNVSSNSVNTDGTGDTGYGSNSSSSSFVAKRADQFQKSYDAQHQSNDGAKDPVDTDSSIAEQRDLFNNFVFRLLSCSALLVPYNFKCGSNPDGTVYSVANILGSPDVCYDPKQHCYYVSFAPWISKEDGVDIQNRSDAFSRALDVFSGAFNSFAISSNRNQQESVLQITDPVVVFKDGGKATFKATFQPLSQQPQQSCLHSSTQGHRRETFMHPLHERAGF